MILIVNNIYIKNKIPLYGIIYKYLITYITMNSR